jgi:acyl-CoA dehydrogenase
MSDIRSMIEETAEKIFRDLCTKELVAEAEQGIWPEVLWNTLEETGMTLVGLTEESGGAGGDFEDALTLLRISGKYAAPLPLAESYLAKWLLAAANYPIVEGAATIAPVKQEEYFFFQPTEEGWIVSGTAKHIPWAGSVKSIVVLGKTSEGRKMIGAVNPQSCDIKKGENLAAEPRDEITLDNVYIPSGSVGVIDANSEDQYWKLAMLSRVVLMAGALENILDLSISYCNEREQFGRPIGKFQAVKQQLAVLAGEVTASGVAAEAAIKAIDQLDPYQEIALAKIQLGEAVTVASKIAHQVIAAMAFTNEHPLHHNTRRVWSWRDEYGTEGQLATMIGERILNQGSENLWPFLTHSLQLEEINN